MSLYHTMQKNIVIGERNTLRTMLSLILCAEPDVMDRVVTDLGTLTEEQLEDLAEAHAEVLHCNAETVKRHVEKIKTGKIEEILWG